MDLALFSLLGVAVGVLGTLIGVGGGFIIVPVLIAVYPTATPDQVTAVSFLAIFANSLSGTIGYARLNRIDYRSGTVFAAATLPGAALGAWATTIIRPAAFEGALAAMMLLGATLLLVLGGKEGLKKREAAIATKGQLAQQATSRALTIGAAISVVVGFLSSLVGIGGGVIHVPAMVFILGFAVHRATATSQFVLAVSSLAAVTVHLFQGSYNGFWPVAIAIGAGAVIGAQIGTRLSTLTPPTIIIRLLAVVLMIVALRLGWRALTRTLTPHTPAVPTSSA